MIRIVGKTENPGAAEVTISLTMSFSDWEKLLAVVGEETGWPYWKVEFGIRKVLNAIKSAYTEVINDDEADMRRTSAALERK